MLAAHVVIAAHGSWERGPLPAQDSRSRARTDLIASHFSDSRLPVDLMPLLSFPGGYGGVDGSTLSSGPIRPGIRAHHADGVFFVGNAAGEAHPIVAEGISMAMAWLLCRRLIAQPDALGCPRVLARIGRTYAADWDAALAMRVRAAALFANVAIRLRAAHLLLPLVGRFPERWRDIDARGAVER